MSRSRTKYPVIGSSRSDRYHKAERHRKFRRQARLSIAGGRYCALPVRYEQVSDMWDSNKEYRGYWPHDGRRFRSWSCDNGTCLYCDGPWRLYAK